MTYDPKQVAKSISQFIGQVCLWCCWFNIEYGFDIFLNRKITTNI